MNVTTVFVALFAFFAVIYGGVIAKDRVGVLISSDSYTATVVECDWRRTRGLSRNGKGASRVRSSYQPIAVSKEGYRAAGRLKVSSKSFCEGLIGHEVKIFVNKDRPEEARINSFFQFWLAPFVFLGFILFGVTCLLNATKTAVGIFFGFFIIGGLATASEFKMFQDPPISPNLHPVDTNLALETCINEAVREEKAQGPSTLKRLICKRRGLTDLTGISDLGSLEYLDLSLNDIYDLSPLRLRPQLRTLILNGNRSLGSLEGLEGLTGLETLKAHCAGLTHIEIVRTMKNLRHLDVSCNQLSSLSATADLDLLEKLIIDDNRAITNIEAVANKPHLTTITMYRTAVSDLSPLMANEKLRSINLGGSGEISCDQVEKLRSRLVKGGRIRGPKNCPKP